MKLVYISGAYLPSRGANAVHVMHQCEAFASLGHDVTLIARTGSQMPLAEVYDHYNVQKNFELVLIPRHQVRLLGALIWAFQVALYVRPRFGRIKTVLYAREVWALYLCVLFSSRRFIYETHWKASGVQKFVEERLVRHKGCLGFVFISKALETIYLKDIPRLSAIPRSIAHDAAQHREAAAPTTSDTGLHVGYVGSFREGYGIPLIVQLARARPEIKFTIVGGSDAEINAVKAGFSEGDIPNLHFTGFIAPKDLQAYYADFAIMLAPYEAKTDHIQWISPMKLFEYMAHGKPVICSDFPVLREVVEHDVTGYLVPAEKTEAWLDIIDRLASSPQTIQKIGQKAYQHYLANHTWPTRGQKILSDLVNE